MIDAHSNFAYSSILTAPSPALSGTTLVLAAGGGALLPVAPFNCTVWPTNAMPLSTNAEIVRVTNVIGDTLTITRAQEGTVARAIIVGDQFGNTITVKCLTDIESALGSAGVYTPTRSAEVNMDSDVTTAEAQYLRNGNTVTVSGRFTANPTAPATTTSFEMSLPIASNFGAIEDAAGVAFCGAVAGMGAAITASVANNTVVVTWVSSDLNSQSWSYNLTYQVI